MRKAWGTLRSFDRPGDSGSHPVGFLWHSHGNAAHRSEHSPFLNYVLTSAGAGVIHKHHVGMHEPHGAHTSQLPTAIITTNGRSRPTPTFFLYSAIDAPRQAAFSAHESFKFGQFLTKTTFLARGDLRSRHIEP